MLGRILDDAGHPVAGARVRLYRRDNRWERRSPLVAEARSEADGAFHISAALTPRPLAAWHRLPPYVLLADFSGKAVGWRILPLSATEFEGDIVLRLPREKTITVIDSNGRAVEGAKVTASILGGPASPFPDLRNQLELRPDDGPLTALTGADGRATLHQLPDTTNWFVATKPGLAETYADGAHDQIRLTPGASLSGRLTGPAGEPLKGVKVVLFTVFMWHFERAVTGPDGTYRFDDLMARGWDMNAWGSTEEVNGKYKLWLDDDRFAIPTQSLTFKPASQQTLDLEAIPAGRIHVTLIEDETNKPVLGEESGASTLKPAAAPVSTPTPTSRAGRRSIPRLLESHSRSPARPRVSISRTNREPPTHTRLLIFRAVRRM